MNPGDLLGPDTEVIIPILKGMLVHLVSDGKAVGRLHGFSMRV